MVFSNHDIRRNGRNLTPMLEELPQFEAKSVFNYGTSLEECSLYTGRGSAFFRLDCLTNFRPLMKSP